MPEVFNPIITHLYANQDGTPKEVTRYNDAIISEINVDNVQYDFGKLLDETLNATSLYRTIKQPVKSATFYGSTKKWNQLVQNGNFNGTSGWSGNTATISASDNVLTAVQTNVASYFGIVSAIAPIPNNHTVLISFEAKADEATNIRIRYPASMPQQSLTTSFKKFSFSADSGSTGFPNDGQLYLQVVNTSSINTVYFKNVQLFDITAIYGAGNEPTASEFLSSLKKDYYPHSNGELISVYRAFTAINGLNIWDEQWEVGGYDVNTGGKKVDNTRIRCKNPIRVLPNTTYFANKALTYLEYDGSGAFTGYFNYLENEPRTFTTHSDTVFITFYPTASYGTTYNHDICISISDPSVNGVYEAYKPTQLIRCYGINLWDEQWEVGRLNSSTGQPESGTNQIRAKNFIRVSPNTECFFLTPFANGVAVFFYDEDKNLISLYGGATNRVLTTPNNCAYIKFYTYGNYGTTYLNNICVNISDSDIDGTYYPYREYSKLSGVGDFNDTLVVNSDGTGSYTKSVGTYTFDGTEPWIQGSSLTPTGMYRYYLNKDIGMKSGAAIAGLCNAFENLGSGWTQSTQEGVFFGVSNDLFQFVTATAKTTAELQAIFNSSVTIVFPLATEVSTQLTQQEVEYILNGAFTYSPYSTLSIGNENEVEQTVDIEIWEQR